MMKPRWSAVAGAMFSMLFVASLHAATISVSPTNPKPGDKITLTIRGTWPSGCPPTNPVVSISGRNIKVVAEEPGPCFVCTAVVVAYTLTVDFTLPADDGGLYTIQYQSLGCASRLFEDVTVNLQVSRTACDFGHSLTLDRSPIRAGDTFNLLWCDPSVFIGPDNSSQVSFYRVYSSRSLYGPFVPIGDQQGATNTRNPIKADETGTTYYYVEAHICSITIAGPQCPARESVTLSNVIAATISPQGSCAPNTTTLCLANSRFQVTAKWKSADGQTGDGRPFPLTNDSGYFWFFAEPNVEITAKMINACVGTSGSWWFFAAGMTNVEVDLTVTDTKTKAVKRYQNQQGKAFSTILDTSAFGTCP